MAYHKYQTEAFILGSREYGEASRVFFLFTDAFGVVSATASGVRKQTSKLKASLQTFEKSRIELVRGKEMWRIVGAAQGERYERVMKDAGKRALYVRIISLIHRFVLGEGMHTKIFYEMQNILPFLAHTEMEAKDILYAEELWNLRFFKELGYVSDKRTFAELVSSSTWDIETVRAVRNIEKEVIAEINIALRAAQV